MKTNHNKPQLPTLEDISRLPLAEGGRYLVDETDMKTIRGRVYALNKHNAAGWKWRTTVIRSKTKSKNPRVIKNLIHTLVVWRVK